jgi:hypothetical protein
VPQSGPGQGHKVDFLPWDIVWVVGKCFGFVSGGEFDRRRHFGSAHCAVHHFLCCYRDIEVRNAKDDVLVQDITAKRKEKVTENTKRYSKYVVKGTYIDKSNGKLSLHATYGV